MSHSPYILGDTIRPRHIKDGWEKLCTNKQTNRHYENNGHLAVNQNLAHGLTYGNLNLTQKNVKLCILAILVEQITIWQEAYQGRQNWNRYRKRETWVSSLDQISSQSASAINQQQLQEELLEWSDATSDTWTQTTSRLYTSHVYVHINVLENVQKAATGRKGYFAERGMRKVVNG